MAAKVGQRALLTAALLLVTVGVPVAADGTTASSTTSSTTSSTSTPTTTAATTNPTTTTSTSTSTSTTTSTTTSSTTTTSTTTTSTSTADASTTSTTDPATRTPLADPSTTAPSTTVPPASVEPSVLPLAAPAGVNFAASTSAGVAIAGPAAAGTGTPSRGSQVQLQAPPTLPPDEVLPPDSGTGRRVVYSKSLQRVWAVDDLGEVVKTHRVSGRLDPLDPRPGTYSVYSRSLHTYAIHNPTITWNYMVRFAKGGNNGNIGFHEIPYQYGHPVQTIAQLGEPLSGGCVRQAPADAIWMWDWAQLGTTVVVLA